MKIEFVTSRCPVCERKVDVHKSLLSHLFTSGRKSTTFGFVRPKGSPRYVKGNVPRTQPKVWAREVALSSAKLIRTIIDLG